MIYGYARCSTNEKLQDINGRSENLNSKAQRMKRFIWNMKAAQRQIARN